MARADVAGITLEYQESGGGEPVVCIHGAFIADTFRSLLAEPDLAGRYRLIAYRRRGYGGSSHPPDRRAWSSRRRTAGRCCGTAASRGPTSSGTPSAAASPCSWRWRRPSSSTRWPCWSRG